MQVDKSYGIRKHGPTTADDMSWRQANICRNDDNLLLMF